MYVSPARQCRPSMTCADTHLKDMATPLKRNSPRPLATAVCSTVGRTVLKHVAQQRRPLTSILNRGFQLMFTTTVQYSGGWEKYHNATNGVLQQLLRVSSPRLKFSVNIDGPSNPEDITSHSFGVIRQYFRRCTGTELHDRRLHLIIYY